MNFEQPSTEENPYKEKIDLAMEIIESGKIFKFEGMDDEVYAERKSVDEEYPGYTTPIDEIIARCKREGVKVVLGKNPESGNVFILPASSDDIESDSILPKHLKTSSETDEKLAELVYLENRI